MIEEEFWSFASSSEASAVVRQILTYVGLPQANFEIRATDQVSRAVAGIHEGRRLILYNENFIRKAGVAAPGGSTNWTRLGILAHEIGHHLAGHTLTPANQTDPNLRRRQELEADRFSGFVLRRMGATREEAQAAVQTYAEVPGSHTHPPRAARLAAVIEGWEAADELEQSAHRELASRPVPTGEGEKMEPIEIAPPESVLAGQGHGFGGWSPPVIRYIRQFHFSDARLEFQQVHFFGTNYGEVWAFNRFTGMPVGLMGRWYPTIPDGTPFVEQIVWHDGNIYRIDRQGHVYFVTWGYPRWVGQSRMLP